MIPYSVLILACIGCFLLGLITASMCVVSGRAGEE